MGVVLSYWTRAEEMELVAHWNTGMRVSLIAAKMGKTRNTIMGKVHRLREQGRLDYRQNSNKRTSTAIKRAENKARPLQRERKPQPMAPVVRSVESPLPPVVVVDIPYDPSRAYPAITQLREGMCKYIMTEDTSLTAFYCGEPKFKKSLCRAHHALCYHPMRKRLA